MMPVVVLCLQIQSQCPGAGGPEPPAPTAPLGARPPETYARLAPAPSSACLAQLQAAPAPPWSPAAVAAVVVAAVVAVVVALDLEAQGVGQVERELRGLLMVLRRGR